MKDMVDIVKRHSLLFAFVTSCVFLLDMLEVFVINDFYKGAFIPGFFLVVKTVLFFHLYKVIHNETNPNNKVGKIANLPRYPMIKSMINMMLIIYVFLDVSSHLSGNSVLVEDMVEAGSVQTFVTEAQSITNVDEIKPESEAVLKDGSVIEELPSEPVEELTASQEASIVLLSTVLLPFSVLIYVMIPCFYHLFFCRFFFEQEEGKFLELILSVFVAFKTSVVMLFKTYWKEAISISFLMSLLVFTMGDASVDLLSVVTIAMMNFFFVISAFTLAKDSK